jgi:hypothetical protein
MPAPIPALNPLWRPTGSDLRDDRELIRGYAGWPISSYNLAQLTSILNRAADASPATVSQVQDWIDAIEDLEETWADQVADGTAHLGNVQSYQGPAPGTKLTRDDMKKRADVLEWDTSLLQVRYEAGTRSDSTAGGVLATRVQQLKGRILQTLGIKAAGGDDQAMLLRC